MSGQNSKKDDLVFRRTVPFGRKSNPIKVSSLVSSIKEEDYKYPFSPAFTAVGSPFYSHAVVPTEKLQSEIDQGWPFSAASNTVPSTLTERPYETEIQTRNVQVTPACVTIPNLASCDPRVENQPLAEGAASETISETLEIMPPAKYPADRMALATRAPPSRMILAGGSQEGTHFETDPPGTMTFATNSQERRLLDNDSPNRDQWNLKSALCRAVLLSSSLIILLISYWFVPELNTFAKRIIWLVVRLTLLSKILDSCWILKKACQLMPWILKKFLSMCVIAVLVSPMIYISLPPNITEVTPAKLPKYTFLSPRHEYHDPMEICRSIERFNISAFHSDFEGTKLVQLKAIDINNYNWSKTEIHPNDSLLEVFLRVPNKKTKFYCRFFYVTK